MSLDPIAVLAASHERLRSLLVPLSPEQVRQRAYPTEWSIAQVASHLGSGAEINLLALAAAESSGPAIGREQFLPVWDRWNAKAPEQQAADAVTSDAELVAAFQRLATSGLVVQQWAGPVDVPTAAALRLSEHAVHTWDIEVALDPAATLPRDPTEVLLPGLDLLVRRTVKSGDLATGVHVVTTDPGAEYLLTLGPESSWAPWDDSITDAELRAPAEAVIRLIYGRLDPDHTPPGVVTEGVDLDQLRAVFPGF